MAIDHILALLAGRDSKTPMSFDELVVASGMDALDLAPELKQMCHWLPAPINCAQITRSGITQMFYWPTGVVEKAERQDITINPKKRPTFPTPPRRGEQKQIGPIEMEVQMQSESQIKKPVSLKNVLDLVICKPGIKREEIIKTLVYPDGSNNKQVRKIIINATQHGRIKVDDEDRFHPGPTINHSLQQTRGRKPAEPKEKTPSGKLVSFKESGQPLPEFAKLQSENANSAKSNARVMLEYLAEHGTATGQELCQLAGTESVGSYLGGPIKRGHLLVEKLGQTSRSGNRYTVAPGVTREQLLADGRKMNTPPSRVATVQTESSEKPSEQLTKLDASTAQPSSNVREFKRPETPDTVKPVSDTEKPELERFYFSNDVYIDATGQLVIQQPGRVRMVFPAPDTRRIQKLLLAIDLESLCDAGTV